MLKEWFCTKLIGGVGGQISISRTEPRHLTIFNKCKSSSIIFFYFFHLFVDIASSQIFFNNVKSYYQHAWNF